MSEHIYIIVQHAVCMRTTQLDTYKHVFINTPIYVHACMYILFDIYMYTNSICLCVYVYRDVSIFSKLYDIRDDDCIRRDDA